MLLGLFSALLVGIGGAIAPGYVFVFVALAINAVSYFFADHLVLRMSGAREIGLEHGAVVTPANVQPTTASLFIVNPLAGAGGLVHWFSTHPPMRERVRRLRDMTVSSTFAAWPRRQRHGGER